jgi:diaminopimelate epimerase
MLLSFTKMHGLGNDFVVFDAVRQRVALSPADIRKLADRRFGIGCDQVLLVESAGEGGIDFRYRIFNADGGEVEQCGNGARCFARFVREKGLTDKTEIVVSTLSGVIRLYVEPNGEVRVNMGEPEFEPARVPFEASEKRIVYTLETGGCARNVSVLSMGNPHAVQIVDDVETAPVESEGPLIERHARFPKGVNAGYLQVLDRRHVRVRVYERGAGETLACGTGACAAVVAGRIQGLLDDEVEVELRGGRLRVAWEGEGQPVWMTGPAATVFEGRIDIEKL